MKTHTLIILALLAVSTIACSYDSESDLIESTEQPGDVDPDILITYVDNIQPIMQTSCVSCHASPPVNGAPFALVNYTQVSNRAGGILEAMRRPNGSAGSMPPSGRLPQATINLVEQWIEDGTLEN